MNKGSATPVPRTARFARGPPKNFWLATALQHLQTSMRVGTGQIKKLAIEHSNNLAFKMLLLLWASNCFWTIIYYPFTWFFEVNIPLTNVLNKFSCTYICRISHLQTIKSVTWFFVRMWQTNCIHQLLFFFSRGTSYEDFILVLSLGLKKKTLITFSVLNQRLEG